MVSEVSFLRFWAVLSAKCFCLFVSVIGSAVSEILRFVQIRYRNVVLCAIRAKMINFLDYSRVPTGSSDKIRKSEMLDYAR